MDSQRFSALITPLLPGTLPARLAVAVSGGADSMALTLLLAEWCKERHIELVALTVNHNLRPEAEAEARQVHTWLEARGIEHHILTHTGEKPASNLMERARELRYALLAEWCAGHGVQHLCVAHHRDDQAETFLMRLMRGSGVDGLAAMAPRSEMHGLHLLRPLLEVPKAELLTYLETQDQRWVEDPTNRNMDYTRNRLRHALREAMGEDAPLLDQRLAATATTLRRVKDALEDYTAQAIKGCVEYNNDGSAALALEPWRSYPEEIRLRVLAEVLQAIGRAEKPLRFEKLERLHHALLEGEEAATLAGCRITTRNGFTRITPEKPVA
jgi:tRNA(Ile)-lysidine synthase